jgi:hypothetical protein
MSNAKLLITSPGSTFGYAAAAAANASVIMTPAPGGDMVRLRGARVFSHSKVSPPHVNDDSFSCVGLQIPLLCCCAAVFLTNVWQLALVQAACYNGTRELLELNHHTDASLCLAAGVDMWSTSQDQVNLPPPPSPLSPSS